MSLVEIELPASRLPLPADVAALLREADVRIEHFYKDQPVPRTGFVPSDFVTVYHALRAIRESNLAAGHAFCEWGSGFGVVAALAAMLEFDACGIETNRDLVDASRELADDFNVWVQFVHGSFIPRGGEAYTEEVYVADHDGMSWLVTEADDAYDELQLDPDDFDLIYAYPWPGDEPVTAGLFENYAARGALLLTHSNDYAVRLRRKM